MPEFYLWNKRKVFEKADILSAFPFLMEKGHVISLVGAGGKTSLMFQMARVCSRRGMRVLVSTTTHIVKPTDGSYAETMEEVQRRWMEHCVAVVGQETIIHQPTMVRGRRAVADRTEQEQSQNIGLSMTEKDGRGFGESKRDETVKLSMLSTAQLMEYIAQADIVFLEADGSKRLPLKVPSEKEPVLLPQCDIVIALCGMSCLGHKLKEKCFRLEEAELLLGKGPQERITEDDIAGILTSDRGSRKLVDSRTYYMVLNQCDDAGRLEAAGRIADRIDAEAGTVVAASLLQ